MPVTEIATRPVSLNARNAVEARSGSRASNRHVAPAIRFDWTVKNAKTFRARPSGLPPNVWSDSPVATTTGMLFRQASTICKTTPARTHAAVAANQARAHLDPIAGHYSLRDRAGGDTPETSRRPSAHDAALAAPGPAYSPTH